MIRSSVPQSTPMCVTAWCNDGWRSSVSLCDTPPVLPTKVGGNGTFETLACKSLADFHPILFSHSIHQMHPKDGLVAPNYDSEGPIPNYSNTG